MNLRFPKSARLRQSSDFARLRRAGLSFHGKYMVVSVLKSALVEGAARVGVITSRRVGGAVVRNRIRRRVREIIRHERASLVDGVWLVVIARQRAVDASYAELRAEWMALAQRADALIPAP